MVLYMDPQRSQEPSLISMHDIGIQYNIVHHLNLMLLSFAFSPFWNCWRIGSFIYLVILIKSIKKWAIPLIKANNFIRSGAAMPYFTIGFGNQWSRFKKNSSKGLTFPGSFFFIFKFGPFKTLLVWMIKFRVATCCCVLLTAAPAS